MVTLEVVVIDELV